MSIPSLSTDVADRGDAGADGRLEPGGAAQHGLGPVLAADRRLRIGPTVEA